MLSETVNTEFITLTPAASKAVLDLIAQNNVEGYALRVYVAGRGCSGLQYGMALDDEFRPEDRIETLEGVKVVIDEVSIEYLRGASIDYVTNAAGTGFKIDNPNSVAGCSSCGSSANSEEGGCCGSDSASSGGSGCGCH